MNHHGRSGSDNGVDIEAIKEIDGHEYLTAVQCKRFIRITKSDLDKIVGKVKSYGKPVHRLLLIVSCDFSKANLEYLKSIAHEAGIIEVKVWAASVIETLLYKDFKDLLFVYFGVRLDSKTRDNAAAIRYAVKMEKRMHKDFIDHKFLKTPDNWKVLRFDRSSRFISSRAIIRSVDDTEYPSVTDTSAWYREHLYDFYHNGLEIWIAAAAGHDVIMDESGAWEPLRDWNDPRKNDPRYQIIRAKLIGRIPFTGIIEYKIDGDSYYNDPHIFCRFNEERHPYEELYYKTAGDPSKEIPDWELDKDKRTVFPKTT